MCYILIRQPESGLSRKSTAECVESFGEPAGVRFLSLCQGFEPFGQFRQTLVPRSLGKTGIHFGVFIGFAFDGRFQVFRRSADGHARNRIADLFEEIEMPEGMTGLRLGSVAKQAAYIGITFNVSDPCEIKVTSVRLRLALEGVFQILVTLRAGETFCHGAKRGRFIDGRGQ